VLQDSRETVFIITIISSLYAVSIVTAYNNTLYTDVQSGHQINTTATVGFCFTAPVRSRNFAAPVFVCIVCTIIIMRGGPPGRLRSIYSYARLYTVLLRLSSRPLATDPLFAVRSNWLFVSPDSHCSFSSAKDRRRTKSEIIAVHYVVVVVVVYLWKLL